MAYCHGSDGVGGGGPRLRQRSFSAERLKRVISEGILGTAMPGFAGGLKPEQIAEVVAFLLSVNREVADERSKVRLDPHLTGGVSEVKERAATPVSIREAVSASRPPAGGGLMGDWRAGQEIFFDAADLRNCRVCHTLHGRGGKVASDLSRLSSEPPREIMRRLLTPGTTHEGRHGAILVRLKSGERITGILRDESEATLRVFDTATLPPVSRSYTREEIAEVSRLDVSGCPGGYGAKFTLKQLLDLIAFIRTSEPAQPASVGSDDLFR